MWILTIVWLATGTPDEVRVYSAEAQCERARAEFYKTATREYVRNTAATCRPEKR